MNQRQCGRWIGCGVILLAGLATAAQAQDRQTVWDGVYTRPQAVRGEAIFASECDRCHDASDFVGDGFVAGWEGQTLRDFYLYLSSKMPPDVHEAIADFQAYADLVAHLLRSNDIPPGGTELPDDLDHLGMIRITRSG